MGLIVISTEIDFATC